MVFDNHLGIAGVEQKPKCRRYGGADQAGGELPGDEYISEPRHRVDDDGNFGDLRCNRAVNDWLDRDVMNEIWLQRSIELDHIFDGSEILERIEPLAIHLDRMEPHSCSFNRRAKPPFRSGDVNVVTARRNTFRNSQSVPVKVPIARQQKQNATRMHDHS